MRVRLAFAVVAPLAVIACGPNHANLCETLDPPPPECTIECDPQPGAVNPCPAGWYCTPDGFCGFECTTGGNECGSGAHCTNDGHCVSDGSCRNFECDQVECAGGATTSLSGVVYAPNGTLPLYNVFVYVPNDPIGAFPDALTCDQCNDRPQGNPLVYTKTDTAGRFTLIDVPAGVDFPLVMQVGRWRRQVTISAVDECVDTPLAADDTRLPRNQSEGDLPRMALTTGGADALECLLRKIGIDDSEFTIEGGGGRVALYAGVNGTDKFDGMHGGADLPNATGLWADVPSLSRYDVTFLSCEGDQNPSTKPAPARQAMKDYTDVGGRVFASHWHNYWLEAGPPPWDRVLTRVSLPDLNGIEADVDQSFSRGADLAQWLLNVGASTTLGKIMIDAAQHTVSAIDMTLAQRWIYKDVTANGQPSIQYLSFTTPLEAAQSDRCGRVVFSDIHVASGDDSDASLVFPSGGCTSNVNVLSPQEKVLAFMIFDIASCIPDVIE